MQRADLNYVPEGFEKITIEKADGTKEVLATLESQSVPEQYGLLEKALNQSSDEKHIFTPLPDSDPGDSSRAYSKSRLSVVVNRLFLLGYLDNDDVPPQLEESYREKVKAFQQDAFGEITLKGDGWIGKNTWSALQELVSFEEPSNLGKWFSDGQPCPALIRAAILRLYALGLSTRAPGHRKKKLSNEALLDILHQSLTGFAGIGRLLGWADAEELKEASLSTLERLFDQDELVARLASASIPEDKKTIKPFIIGMAKIELWLIGYDIRPTGYAGGSVNTTNRGLYLKTGSQLFKQLKKYWQCQGVNSPGLKALKLIRTNFPKFFSSISERLSAAEKDEDIDSKEVYKQLLKKAKEDKSKNPDRSFMQQVWEHVYSIGARIWDGIKRAWRWFKSMVRAGIAYLKNLSRLAYNFILKSFEAVRAVVAGVVGSLSFFGKSEMMFPLRGLGIDPGPHVLRMRRDGDFDFTTFVNDKGKAKDAMTIAHYLENKSGMFAVSCKFLASLLDMVIDLIKKSIFSGVAVLLMALLKLYKNIKDWAPGIIGFVRQEQQMLAA